MQISYFLEEKSYLRTLLNRSKSLTAELQAEVTLALKSVLGRLGKKVNILDFSGVCSNYWETGRARATFGPWPWIACPDSEMDIMACIEARIGILEDGEM